MCLLCEQHLQKERGEVHTIQLLAVAMEPIQTPTQPATLAAFAMESKKGKLSAGEQTLV